MKYELFTIQENDMQKINMLVKEGWSVFNSFITANGLRFLMQLNLTSNEETVYYRSLEVFHKGIYCQGCVNQLITYAGESACGRAHCKCKDDLSVHIKGQYFLKTQEANKYNTCSMFEPVNDSEDSRK
ncbi:hypothetical protein KAR91_10670 [Candidatus Pacearchaeota archaeon]|nr:hypothetical protein [Candidatus Pacearchaeota archaeon]